MPRPRGGDWLEDEIRSWGREGVDLVLSLLTAEETAELNLSDEGRSCLALGLQFQVFPIKDRDVPSSREAVWDLVTKLSEGLASGKNVAVHCRQGIGRAALIAICLLVVAGVDAEVAMQQVSSARGCPVPETPEQRRWITMFARSLASQPAR